MSTYREVAEMPPADQTTIECAKIHEAAETKRHTSEQWTKRLRLPIDFYEDGDFSKFLTLLVFLGGLAVLGTGCAIVIMYFQHLWFK
jgi:hypothetical protein